METVSFSHTRAWHNHVGVAGVEFGVRLELEVSVAERQLQGWEFQEYFGPGDQRERGRTSRF
jgi:hypothetical protein